MLKRFFLIVFLALAPRLSAQDRGAAALSEALGGLGNTMRVLMIGAHPDDEDTQLIAYLAKARHVETAYLSLTRGDGGQNLIGNELGPELGMIRTEELLAARRLDGGRQYFTRAYDFGFSKTLEETLQHWPKDSILKDAVEIVRAFRPHVIISVWTGTPADGHGHHQYAGVIARDVFDAAADSVRFPEARAGGLPPWSTPKFYRLRRRGAGSLVFNVGQYDPVLGESYSELATLSRTQHRSQGQGEIPQQGPRFTGVQLEQSRVSDAKGPERDLFDGVDTTWARFKNLSLADSVRASLDSLPAARARVERSRDLLHPSKMVEPLAAYARLVDRVDRAVVSFGDLHESIASMHHRADDALMLAAGVDVETTAPRELIAERDSMPIMVSIYNRGETAILASEPAFWQSTPGRSMLHLAASRRLLPDSTARSTIMFHAPTYYATTAWWLADPPHGDMFTQSFGDMITGEDRLPELGPELLLSIGGQPVQVHAAPIVHRRADPVVGEIRRPVAVVPEITVLLDHEVEYARANEPLDRTVRVSVRSAWAAPREVSVSLRLPRGLNADTVTRHVTLPAFGEANLEFRVRGRLAPGRDSIRAIATANDKQFTRGYIPIEYEHIHPLRYYRDAVMRIEAVQATFASTLKVGYVRGVGDNVRPMLQELGIPVTELDPARLAQENLSQFTTIVIGSRAYESPSAAALMANETHLMKFAQNGGTIVTQYGKSEMALAGILPYPITLTQSGDRVTDETAPVRVLDLGSPLLASPNAIGESDFANWVQERSLYMPHTFDKQWRTVLSMNDKNEPPNDAPILLAPVGKGVYIYTTLSFFRQLPAGNPGAARLFINLLSADHAAAMRPAVPASAPARP